MKKSKAVFYRTVVLHAEGIAEDRELPFPQTEEGKAVFPIARAKLGHC